MKSQQIRLNSERSDFFNMKHCDKCNVNVAGNRKICPLCQTVLTGTGEDEIYPYIPTFYSRYKFLIKTAVFISITICILALSINYMIPQSGYWSPFAVLGVASVWTSVYTIIKKGSNIPKTILYHVVIVSALSALWDKVTGWHGWSFDFVIPSACIAGIIATVIVIKICKMRIQNCVFFIFIDSIFGIIPIILYSAKLVNIRYPSIICTALSVITIAGLLIFQSRNVTGELQKKFHI